MNLQEICAAFKSRMKDEQFSDCLKSVGGGGKEGKGGKEKRSSSYGEFCFSDSKSGEEKKKADKEGGGADASCFKPTKVPHIPLKKIFL